VRGRAHWIAHVVQAIEDRYEIVVLARKVLGFRHLKANPVRNALPLADSRAASIDLSW